MFTLQSSSIDTHDALWSAIVLYDGEYIEALWWLMHHSGDPERRSFAVVCYVDDSGTQENGILAVMGGPVIPRQLLTSFHLDWDTVLTRHKVTGPVHMREFGRPHGRFAYLNDIGSPV
jgi:hypothetical protein